MHTTILATLRGPRNEYFQWNLRTGDYLEQHPAQTPAPELDTINNHAPQPGGVAKCGRCDSAWPCAVIKVLRDHCGYTPITLETRQI